MRSWPLSSQAPRTNSCWSDWLIRLRLQLTSDQQTFLWGRGLERATVDMIPQLNPDAIESLSPAPRGPTMGGLPADAAAYVYTATNATVTADDVSEPLLNIRARKVRIQPGHRIEAEGAVLYAGEVPVFYLPLRSQPRQECQPLQLRAWLPPQRRRVSAQQLQLVLERYAGRQPAC